MSLLGSPTRSFRNAVDEDNGRCALGAALAAGGDPHALLTNQPISRRTCEELAELDAATLGAAVVLNSDTHPCLAALVASRDLKDRARAQRGRNAGVAESLVGAMRCGPA